MFVVAFLTRFFTLFLNFLYSGKHFSFFSLSLSAIVSLMFLLSHGSNYGCFTLLRFKGACLLTTARIDIVPCRQGFIGISTIQKFSERGPVRVIEKGSLVKMFERSK